MAQLNIFYITKNTMSEFIGIDKKIEDACSLHGGRITGSGMGPEGREVVVEVFPDTEVKNVVLALNKMHQRMIPAPLKFKVDIHLGC
jgi:hypothetical protein